MTPEGITRKLIAILSADVKDYTRLMSQDDVGTIRTLTAYKEAMETLIRATGARWWMPPGTTSWPASTASWMR